MEGIDAMAMVGTGVDAGCSATRGGEVAGGETMGAGCGGCEGSSTLLSSGLVASSSFAAVASSSSSSSVGRRESVA